MLLNGHNLMDRYNRPSVTGKVAIRTLFMNNGEFIEPYDVSSCNIFAKSANSSPGSIIDPITGLLSDDASSQVLMSFGISGNNDHVGDATRNTQSNLGSLDWFPDYVPGDSASGIYRDGETGSYIAVLDGEVSLSGVYDRTYDNGGVANPGIEVANGASSVQEYIDVWTVKLAADSEYQVFINSFKLYNDVFTTLTEPVIVTASNRLVTKNLSKDSEVDLIITTDLTVQNRNLSEELKNIIKDYKIIMNAGEGGGGVEAYKYDQGTGGFFEMTPFTYILPYSPLGIGAPRVSSNNTITIPIDTTKGNINENWKVGEYYIRLRYSFLDQVIVTPKMYFTIT